MSYNYEDTLEYYKELEIKFRGLLSKSSKAYSLLILLFKYMSKNNSNAVVASTDTLAKLLNVTQRTIQRSVKILKEDGWIYVLKSGNTNAYIVNPKLKWKNYNENEQYCSFSACVIVSSTENPNKDKITGYYNEIYDVIFKNIKEIITSLE